MIKIWDRLIKRLKSEFDKQTYPSQTLLGEWFDRLWEVLEKQKTLGNVIKAAWYQIGIELKLVTKDEIKNISEPGERVYDVDIVPLPSVKVKNVTYNPTISQITSAISVTPEQEIEVLSWRLDLSLNPINTEANFPDIQFMKMQDLKKQKVTYEILDQTGKEVHLAEIKFVKKIFDVAIEKLN